MNLKIHFFVPFIFINVGKCVDLSEECKATEDGHLTRGYFTCCGSGSESLPVISSLDIPGFWKKCALEPDSPNEDPVISAWRVYRCIVFSSLRGNPLRPTTFANFVTSKYPVSLKSKLLAEMSALEVHSGNFEVDIECLRRTPYPKVHLVRNLFYDAEQKICEEGERSRKAAVPSSSTPNKNASLPFNRRVKGFSKSDASSDFASVLCNTCDRTQEMYHRNGDCCSHVPLPFPFLYLPIRYGNNDRVGQCAEDLVDDVGLPSDTTFANRLKYLCYPSCEYYLSGILSENDFWVGADQIQTQSVLRSLVLKMMPAYFAPKYKDEVQTFIIDNFQTAWAETPTFESKINLSQRDLRNCDKGKLKNLLSSCKAHRLVETMTNLYLAKLCEEDYPVLENDGNKSPSNTSGNLYPHNPYPTIKDPPATAIVELNWKTGGRSRSEDDIVENRIRQYFAHKNTSFPVERTPSQQTSSASRPAKSSFW